MPKQQQGDPAAIDVLIGAQAIRDELVELGLLQAGAPIDQVYYLARDGHERRLPIGKFGKSLIASRAKLRRAVAALTEAAE